VDEIASPCTGTCRLDVTGESCLGCRRTIDEIAFWSTMDRAGKHRVLARLAALNDLDAGLDGNDPGRSVEHDEGRQSSPH
jgi:predicted Fe-S protein YdhL (DUF1289 family)